MKNGILYNSNRGYLIHGQVFDGCLLVLFPRIMLKRKGTKGYSI